MSCEQCAAAQARADLFEKLACYDALTGLGNRREAERHMVKEFARCRRHGLTLTVGVLDVDAFKLVNDVKGHATGDEVLCDVGSMIRASMRPYDGAYRWGGDEFLVVLPSLGLAGARSVCERIRRSVESLPWGVTVTAGVAELLDYDRGMLDVVDRADKKMLEAKSRGKNRVI